MPSTFELDISRFVQKVQGRMDTAVRRLALEAFQRVVFKSPVDTGRFRGNWQLAIGSIPDGVLEIDDREGTMTVNRATAAASGAKAGDIIYLANNLPYARRLEYGWSGQAPAGMVRPTIAEMQAWMSGIAQAASREVP
jgi:PAS domain-containing protein